MAKFTGTYTTGDAKGLRENLTDMIYDISPTKTPLMQMAGREKATAILHEWQIETLADPDTTNSKAEGNEATFATPAATERVGTYVQISDKTCIVSGTLESVSKAGRRSEMAKQMNKRSKELKRDMEKIALANQAASGTDPRDTAGLPAWLKTNTVFVTSDGADPSYTTLPNDARTDSASPVAFTEAMLQTAVNLAWDEGAEPHILMAGAFNKNKISNFDGIAAQTNNLNGAKPGVIIGSADIYVSEFGNLKVVPNRYQRTSEVFGLDPEYNSFIYLRGFKTKKLAPTGDAEKRLLNVEWGLKVHNEKAHFGIFDLTAA
jgi:outer membrane murein-binding lipoprotein Lpp